MNTAESILSAMPLPRQVVANSIEELNKKVFSLSEMHGDFLLTDVKRVNGSFVTYIKKKQVLT